MILIFGGAYQGKLEYAKDNFSVDIIFDCRSDGSSAPDFSADVICGIEAFVFDCTKKGVEAADWFRDRKDMWQDKILIIRDQSQGIVPIDPDERAAREMCGRLMIYLAGEAEQVIRVFCGLGEKIRQERK